MSRLNRVIVALAGSLLLSLSTVGCGGDSNSGLGDAAPGQSDQSGQSGDGGGGDAKKTGDLSGVGSGDLAGTNTDGSGGDLAGPCNMNASCYSGPNGTLGVGVCQAGVQQCVAGVLGSCTGEIDPSAESCNGFDDDCNGLVDDGLGTLSCGIGACKNTVAACTAGKPTVCIPNVGAKLEICGNGIDDNCNGLVDEGCGCVYVAPFGSDLLGTGAAGAPFKTIGKGITVAGTNGLPKIVCVASGLQCPSQADYPESLGMRDGVSVYGGYQAAGNTWPRTARCVTRILDQNHAGVVFDKTVAAQTILDGFTILGHNDNVATAITVAGSTGAVISNNQIAGGGAMDSSGIEVIDNANQGATPLISQNGIVGGRGTGRVVGVHSLNSAPTIQGNCDAIDMVTGRCTSNGCFGINPQRFIRARPLQAAGTESYGILLEGSPKAIVDQNAVCASAATADEAAIRLTGNGAGVLIHANNLTAFGTPMNSVGLWADPCAGASPWLLDNSLIAGNTQLKGGRADGVRAIGDCHPRVDSNLLIVGGEETAAADANGVFCMKDNQSGISSRCTVLNNVEIRGSSAGFPPTSTGVHCDDGACARIEFNALITGRGGQLSYGVFLLNTNTFVNANRIDAGCGVVEGIGLFSNNSTARVQNNLMTGSVCPNMPTPSSYAVRAILGTVGNELDLHSNDLFGAGAGQCTSRGLAVDIAVGGLPPPPLGIVRNNIIYAGGCATSYAIEEQNAAADLRLLENNDLYAQNGMPTALYRDEAMTDITTVAAVNMLNADPTAAANFSADPMFVNGLHIPANSPCTNTGTSAGAPSTDFELDARPQQNAFDVGMDEYKP